MKGENRTRTTITVMTLIRHAATWGSIYINVDTTNKLAHLPRLHDAPPALWVNVHGCLWTSILATADSRREDSSDWRPRSPVSTLESSRRNGVFSSSRFSDSSSIKPCPSGLVGLIGAMRWGRVNASSLRRPVAGHGGGFAAAHSMMTHKTARTAGYCTILRPYG